MAEQSEAKEAIFSHIVESLAEVRATCEGATRATAIKDLALAYRLTAGGTQPGSAVLTK